VALLEPAEPEATYYAPRKPVAAVKLKVMKSPAVFRTNAWGPFASLKLPTMWPALFSPAQLPLIPGGSKEVNVPSGARRKQCTPEEDTYTPEIWPALLIPVARVVEAMGTSIELS
jgi:hypothetical protein